jgi:ATP adenylyltransferase
MATKAEWAEIAAIDHSRGLPSQERFVLHKEPSLCSCRPPYALMDILRAYWRMEYVASNDDPTEGHANPFAELPHLGDDRKALIIHRGSAFYIVLNRYPYNPGHVLIVPFTEVAHLEDLDRDARLEMMDLTIYVKQWISLVMQPHGFNVGFNLGKSSGAGIPTHLHAHVVPRWDGDCNFMPVIGQTRTLPQALDQTWEVLMKQKPDA